MAWVYDMGLKEWLGVLAGSFSAVCLLALIAGHIVEYWKKPNVGD